MVYFSRVGNTEFPEGTDAVSSASLLIDEGQLKGNAQMTAEWIAEEAGCETFEITVQEPTEGLAIQGRSVPDSEQEIRQWVKDNR